ncbi:YaiI/YqxD family protein [Halomicronema sp. CCY15110]|uniref:YaiI/YqxD family protein n=1 Tax=Halomicronema sp. CCY15110 TaxID=2767773 RepID=UPI00195098F1|nr:YaiI/YqxD family protein [Halomicronema sp. CCY15110]
MQIWVDADACPKVIKEIIFRAARRVGVATTLVANQELIIPASEFIEAVQVKAGLDVADTYIVQHLTASDLVITADIPLAAEAIAQSAYVLTPRGEFLDRGTIRQRLSMRNFLEELRNSGVETGGPPPLHTRDREAFANQLDRFLTQHA